MKEDKMSGTNKMISVIVPCYNEEEGLRQFYEETRRILEGMRTGGIKAAGAGDGNTEAAAGEVCAKVSRSGVESASGEAACTEAEAAAGEACAEVARTGVAPGGPEYELLFVDDGSRDGTSSILKELALKDERCRYIMFSRNFGKEAAMYAGLTEARGDYCVMMDADLQHPPALLPEMYRAVDEEGWDCCGGKRIGREGDGALRSLLSRAFYKICKALTHLDMGDGYGDFRMMKRTMVNAIIEMKEYNRYMKGIFSFVGFQTKWIPYENVERAAGTTKWNFRSLFRYAMEGILSFSTAPLKVAGVVGVLLLLAGGLLLGGNLLQGLWMPLYQAMSEMELVLSVVLLLGGMQMIFLYILGAYLSKDYMENKKRPVYIVRERG